MRNASRFALTGSILAILASAAHAQTAATPPNLPPGPVCAVEKSDLVNRASVANGQAAVAAQEAARRLSERQAALGTRPEGAAEIERLRLERDRQTDSWRRAEAVLDAAMRLSERPCDPPTRTAQATDATGTGPGGGGPRPGLSLALSISAPERCAPSATCAITVEIHNRGTEVAASPLLASLALGFDGGTIPAVMPDVWTCGRGGEQLSCASAGLALQPDTRTRFTVEWRLPERLRRPSATVCARVVWPARGSDGVYRAEQVAAVQYALTRAGFDTGGISGRLTPRTIEAIRTLRSRVGLQGAAEITPDLLANLFGANGAIGGDDDPSNDSACATVAFGPNGTPSAAAPAQPAPATPPAVATPMTPTPQPTDPGIAATQPESPPSMAALPPPTTVTPTPGPGPTATERPAATPGATAQRRRAEQQRQAAAERRRQERLAERELQRQRAAAAAERRRQQAEQGFVERPTRADERAQEQRAQRRQTLAQRREAERRARLRAQRQMYDDDVVLTRRPWGQPRVVWGPNGPVYVYPAQPQVIRPWAGPPVIYRPWW